jgi:hypothetical protein
LNPRVRTRSTRDVVPNRMILALFQADILPDSSPPVESPQDASASSRSNLHTRTVRFVDTRCWWKCQFEPFDARSVVTIARIARRKTAHDRCSFYDWLTKYELFANKLHKTARDSRQFYQIVIIKEDIIGLMINRKALKRRSPFPLHLRNQEITESRESRDWRWNDSIQRITVTSDRQKGIKIREQPAKESFIFTISCKSHKYWMDSLISMMSASFSGTNRHRIASTKIFWFS